MAVNVMNGEMVLHAELARGSNELLLPARRRAGFS